MSEPGDRPLPWAETEGEGTVVNTLRGNVARIASFASEERP